MNRKWLVLFVLCIISSWVMHVVRLNERFPQMVVEYGQGESFHWRGICVTPVDSIFLTPAEYENYIGTELDEMNGEFSGEDRVLGLKVRVENHSGQDIDWDIFFDAFGLGFETLTWANGIDPFLGQNVNRFSSEVFESGQVQEFWLLTEVNRNAFSDRTWESLNENSFFYVLETTPEKICIRIE
ncbi:MAG: hypothetical protein NC347_04490 [Clostridium sp.]|nr:hypothetical protein [Clostridium sp.]